MLPHAEGSPASSTSFRDRGNDDKNGRNPLHGARFQDAGDAWKDRRFNGAELHSYCFKRVRTPILAPQAAFCLIELENASTSLLFNMSPKT